MNTKGKKGWRNKVREYLALAFGGKCTICGYDKTIRALDYHHVDPENKDSLLSEAMRNGHAWSKIVEEARKCTLVCCRCHREIHAGVTKLPKNYARFNEEYVDVIKLQKTEFDSCPICGQEKFKKLKTCGRDCAAQSQKKFDVTKDELEKLVLQYPYETVGVMYGVSGKTIKKRCLKFGIDLGNRQGYWNKK